MFSFSYLLIFSFLDFHLVALLLFFYFFFCLLFFFMFLFFFVFLYLFFFFFFFFFSSRRRHTRCSRDWSSDVCSSDLTIYGQAFSPTTISTSVPVQVGSGRITVATAAGTAVSSADFFVPPSP